MHGMPEVDETELAREEDIKSFVSMDYATAFWQRGLVRERGVAEASRMPGGYWYVNRVRVEPPGIRGRGIGGRLLERLKAVLRENTEDYLLVVDPGGYGEDPDRQRAFYAKHGFMDDQQTPGRMVYRLKERSPD